MANMGARLILRQKDTFPDGTIREMIIWELPEPVPGSAHRYKYRFFFGLPGRRLIGYDNERGKGDHRHIGASEQAYRFTDPKGLVRDFYRDIARWRQRPDADHLG